MKISIIIPVYNTGTYLEKCVKSVLVSADEDCEILLIDDGSTDGISGPLCDQLVRMNSSVVRVIHQPNKGLGGARNTGIENATGDYLLFLDSDDSLHPDTISRIRQAVEAHDADIVTFNMTIEYENGKLENLPSGYVSGNAFALEDRRQFMMEMPSACNKAWRRELFMKSEIRFPERVWYEDIRTTVKLYALAERIITLPDYLYLYFQRTDSIMHSNNLSRNGEIMDAMDDILFGGRLGEYKYYDMDAVIAVALEQAQTELASKKED